ncbi:hypothetical protein [Marispirochaeta aestuarii]|uniref:hypothetical protein n=1 Tax=Marispirochaeta aestuarii TaxID=1963862 RepID=UPI0029C9B277|nr:hypothetical protein [Marispirochaeta aestuarii]
MTDFGSLVRAHGKTQLEIKNRYPLPTEKTRVSYSIDAFMFTPAQLGINDERFSVDQFFSDVKSHTRFSISYVPLARLVDPGCSISPLTRIRNYLDTATFSADMSEHRVLYELRTLANLFSAEMKATYRLLSDIASAGISQHLVKKTEKFLDEASVFLQQFREFHSRFMEPSINSRIRTAMRWSDESISLSAEKMLFYLHRVFDGHKIQSVIENMMKAENQHRREMKYPSVLKNKNDSEIERILYRESILKKWAQTVLYMSSEETGTNRKIGHILAGVAAAAAMTFAIVATFFAERLFASYSIPWAMIIVVSYMLKDRIKEILRGILLRIMPRFISDRTEKLVDQILQKNVGKTKSMVRLVQLKETPHSVQAVRNAGANPFQTILPPENIIHFRKDITIKSGKLMKEHSRIEAVTEIIRVKMDRFLEEMDDAKKLLRTWKDGRLSAVKGKRVYHINLVLRLVSSEEDEEQVSRYRLVVNRQGIQRIEEVVSR